MRRRLLIGLAVVCLAPLALFAVLMCGAFRGIVAGMKD